ncbi:transcription elongation factor Spt5 [Candidatus Nanopusillus massiliensis]
MVVTSGREELVADILANEGKNVKYAIYSIIQIPGVKGYLFVETTNSLELQRAVLGIRDVKRVLPQEIPIDELLKYFEEEKGEYDINDIVEVLSGACKGTRGKIINIDEKKKEVTKELIDVPVPLH